jgi:lysophospholipid acyltransferase (LPLAT)-like uncharacterized protein
MNTEQPDNLWKPRLQAQIFALVSQPFFRSLDYRLYHFDRTSDPALPEYNEHCIFVFWHEHISVLLSKWGHIPLTVLCSKHRDGEIVSQAALARGLHIVRGSSNRDGAKALRQLKKHSQFSSIAITPDGPRGPRREMAIGPIFLASLLQLPIVPVGIGIDRAWRLNTWDQFAIPKPFARVRVITGPKIRIPKNLARPQLESNREGIAKLLIDLGQEAQVWAESGLKLNGEQHGFRTRKSNRVIFERQPSCTGTSSPSTRQNAEASNKFTVANRFSDSMKNFIESACQIEGLRNRA